jgi:uncharacterized membrane protein HdeD (DUF308 family)
MSTATTRRISDMQEAIRDAVHEHWKLLLFQGSVMIILGILAIAAPFAATIAVDYYVGALFLLSGIVGLVAMFSVRDVAAFFWAFLTAALSLAVGVLLLWKPVEGAASLTIVLTAFFIAEGIFQIAGSLSYRDVLPGAWGWMLASGIADLVLAAIIIMSWPVSAAWTLGLIVGINLITSGWAIVFTAIEGRSFTHTHGRAAA